MANKSKTQGKSHQQEQRPSQSQDRQPGRQYLMEPQPESVPENYQGSEKLAGKVALITGGDSGIGRSAAVLFAREGADVAVVYLEESTDADQTRAMVEAEGQQCLLIQGDIGCPQFCRDAVRQTVDQYHQLDILVNNAAEQHVVEDITEIDEDQLLATFRTNVFSMFYLTQAALPYLRHQPQSTIINTASITAYRGSPGLIDYSATKGAIISFTRSLSQSLVKEGIRVNAVAPGPIWTPLIPATFEADRVREFGSDSPMGRAGQPYECGTCFVFLASQDSSYLTGQVIHPNGGEIINT